MSNVQPEDTGTGEVSDSTNPTVEDVRSAAEKETQRITTRVGLIMEDFQRGNIKGYTALSAVIDEYNTIVYVSDEEKEKGLRPLIEEIYAASQPLAKVVGSSTSQRFLANKPSTSKRPNGEINEFLERVTEGDASDDDEDKPPPTKRQLQDQDMPWYRPGNVNTRRSSCTKSCEILDQINSDYKGYRFRLQCAPSLPAGIPNSQWEKILKGEAVDLNYVLSSLHYVGFDEERKGRVGKAELVLGVPEAKRTVKSISDWSPAFRSAARAIAFVFPHLEQELSEYATYIERLFSAKQPQSHSRIVLYDMAIRNEVAGGQNHLLTDIERFSHLYAAIVPSDGVEYGNAGIEAKKKGKQGGGGSGGNGGNTRASGSKGDEICHNFNGQSGCKFTEDNCHFKHTCKKCGKGGHGRHECPQN